MDNPPRFVIRLTLSSARVLLGSAAGGLIGARLGGAFGAFLGGLIGTLILCLLPGPTPAATPAEPEDGEGEFDENGQPHGPWLWKYADGQPKHQVQYEHGVAEGPETYWYPSGRKEIQCRRVGGRRDGDCSFFHPNGELASRGLIRAESREGEWSYYNPDGTLLRTCHYVGNQLEGRCTTFGPDGDPILEERYAAGLLHGIRAEDLHAPEGRTETLLVAGVPVPAPGRRRFSVRAGTQLSPQGWLLWSAVLLFLVASFAKDPSVGVGLLLIAVAIALHEFGHLVGAWLVGIPIEQFRVGIGPTIARVRWGITTFELGLIPVLGFVKPFEMRPADYPLYRSMRRLIAGSPAEFRPELPPPDSSPGDAFRPMSDLVARPKRLVYLLAGLAVNLAIGVGIYLIHNGPRDVHKDLPLFSAEVIKAAPESVAKSFRPSTYEGSQPGAVAALGSMARVSWHNFFLVFGAVNLCLVVFNALPIPPLDGFHATVVAIEMLLGREIPRKVMALILIGGTLLLCVLVFSNILSIFRDLANALRR